MYFYEPHKSCSLFGALRYLSNIKDAVILIHGPFGCSFFNRNGIIRLNGYYSAPYKVDIPKIFCTGFNENDAIFGAEDKVKNAITEIIEKFSPKIVFVMNCCVSEITGENIDDISSELSSKYDVRVIPVHSAGFKGDHRVGMHMASDIIFNEFICDKPNNCDGKTVNIIGEFDYFNNCINELISELNKIGVNKIIEIPGKSGIDDFMYAGSSDLTLVSCGFAGMRLAKQLQNKYNVPYVGTGIDLYGIENTYKYYSKIYDFFNYQKDELEIKYENYKNKLKEYNDYFKNKTAFVVAGMRRAVGYSAILEELGISIEFIFSEVDPENYSKDIFLKYSKSVISNDPAFELYNLVEEKKPDIVLSTLSELIAPHKYITRTDEDFAGFEGAIRMAEYLKKEISLSDDSLYVSIQN